MSILGEGRYHPKFSRKQLRSVWDFKNVIYVQRNPRSYFIGKFRSIRGKLRYQFYLGRNKTAEIMEEICEVGPKNLRKNFGLINLSRHEMFLVISCCRKCLVISTPKPDNFLQLLWTKCLWAKCFYYMCQEFRWNLYGQKFKTKEIFIKIEISACHNCFSVLCSYKNSCFCLVVIKVNVKVLGNFWVPYQQIFFLGDHDCILAGLILKACLPFASENDLTHNLISF